jgi:signal transduction histidine kinase
MFRVTQPSQIVIRRCALVLISMIVAIAAALTIAILFLDLATSDIPTMIELLLTSAVISLGVGGLFVWTSGGTRWNRLATRLLAAHAIGIIVILVNIVIAAYAMFISTHDLSLLTLLLAYSVAIAGIYSILVSLSIGDSLRALVAASQRMSAGDLSVRVPAAPERELAELGAAFNTMASRLEMAFQRQRELEEARQGLIAAVSHDLRTPLASLRVMVEAVNDGVARDPETVQRYIGAMERETISLGRLIDDLFEMARLDSGQVQLRLEPSPITALVQSTLEAMQAQASSQGVMLRSSVDDSAVPPVLIDPDRIQRVLYNLIQNAIRHTPADGSVIVAVHDRGPEIQVDVRDTGEGILLADLPHVFDRFYRGDKARSRDSDAGAGLGLSIARRLIETHGGRIWVVQPPEGGSIFSFTLPKMSPQR